MVAQEAPEQAEVVILAEPAGPETGLLARTVPAVRPISIVISPITDVARYRRRVFAARLGIVRRPRQALHSIAVAMAGFLRIIAHLCTLVRICPLLEVALFRLEPFLADGCFAHTEANIAHRLDGRTLVTVHSKSMLVQ